MRRHLPLLVFALVLVAVGIASLGLGQYPVPPLEVARLLTGKIVGQAAASDERLLVLEKIIFDIRLPRLLAGALVGAALSASGASCQALFVNPLVSPSILGVLAGASFGAALGIVAFHSFVATQALTFVGGFAAVGLAVGVSLVYRARSDIMLVLGGVVSGMLFTSLVSILKFVADPYNQLPTIVYWLMGSFTAADSSLVLKAAIPIGLGLIGLLITARHLNVLSMGEDEARTMGVNVSAVRASVIFCSTLASSMTVVVAGAIAWVGLIVPHLTRMIVGPDNEVLIPASALFGAIFLVLVDDVCRLAFRYEVPVGVVTALIGIPCFLVVLGNARKAWR